MQDGDPLLRERRGRTMIVDTFACGRAYALGPLWDRLMPELLELIGRAGGLAEGVYPLAGGVENGGATATVKVDTLRERAEARYESHMRMADIQAVLEGDEYLEVLPLCGGETETENDAGRDLVFYARQPEGTRVHLVPGLFALILPGEAHMPGVKAGGGRVRKLVVKIPADRLQAPSCLR